MFTKRHIPQVFVVKCIGYLVIVILDSYNEQMESFHKLELQWCLHIRAYREILELLTIDRSILYSICMFFSAVIYGDMIALMPSTHDILLPRNCSLGVRAMTYSAIYLQLVETRTQNDNC